MNVIKMGMYRPNLNYEVLRVTNDLEKRRHLALLLKEIEGTGIIYAATVKQVEAVTEFLRKMGFEVVHYHGRLGARERRENHERFMAGGVKAIVATNAFGLGIDKPDIRFVIHYNVPGALESYYQESGRAGRDGELARCVLLYQLDDRRTQMFFLGGRYPKIEDISEVYDALQRLQAGQTPAKIGVIQESAEAVAKTRTRVILSAMKDMELVKEERGSRFRLLKTDLSISELEQIARQYEQRSEDDRRKLEKMMLYAQSAACRWKGLLGYFGEALGEERCGHCDNCLHPLEEQIEPAKHPDRRRGLAIAF